jgi:RecA/RadA recombinase
MDLDKIISGIKVDGVNCYAEAEAESWNDVDVWIPTGSPFLDYAIGGFEKGKKGGIPIGKITEISGKESTGKSSLLDHIIRETLNLGGAFFLCDKEHAHEVERMKLIGCDLTNFRFIEKPKEMQKYEDEAKEEEKGEKGKKKSGKKGGPDDVVLEEFLDIAEKTIKKFRGSVGSEIPIVIALDSLASIDTLIMSETKDANMKDRLDKSRVMSDRFPDLCSIITKNNGALIIVNQLREKPNTYGDSQYSPGGNAQLFYFSLRLRMNSAQKITAGEDIGNGDEEALPEDVVGISCSGTIIKNKVSKPFRKFTFPYYFDSRGIWDEQSFAELIVAREKWRFDKYKDFFQKGSVKSPSQGGNTFWWRGEAIGVGKDGLTRAFLDDPGLRIDMEEELFG